MRKTYSGMMKLHTFAERLTYLQCIRSIGEETMGVDRYLAEQFYCSAEWRRTRDYVILRDNGCDLAMPGMEIGGRIFIHHIEPITREDICHSAECMLDMENLVCVSRETHNAIHYGAKAAVYDICERCEDDTRLW